MIDLLESSALASEPGLFAPIASQLLGDDPYCLLADYRSYLEAQDAVNAAWRSQPTWRRSAILNVARVGQFSSDRSIREYANRVWGMPVATATA